MSFKLPFFKRYLHLSHHSNEWFLFITCLPLVRPPLQPIIFPHQLPWLWILLTSPIPLFKVMMKFLKHLPTLNSCGMICIIMHIYSYRKILKPIFHCIEEFIPPRHVDWFKNLIPTPSTFEECNMANISLTTQVDIWIKLGITKNILLGTSCTCEEVVIYKTLFQGFCDVFTWS